MSRLLNLAGQALIKDSEGLRLTAYRCPAGVLTIGWGHTGPDVYAGMTISQTSAVALFNKDIEWAEDCVSAYCKVPPDDNQYAAMVAMCQNVGPDPKRGFPSSSVLRLHNAGKFSEAAAAFSLWNKMTDPSTGQLVVSPGLTIRRAREAALYMTPLGADAVESALNRHTAPPVPQAVEPPKSLTTSSTVITAGVSVAAGAAGVADQVTPAIQAVQNASDAASGAATSIGAVKAALGSLIDGRALTFALAALALGCAVYFLVRYIRKARAGQVVST